MQVFCVDCDTGVTCYICKESNCSECIGIKYVIMNIKTSARTRTNVMREEPEPSRTLFYLSYFLIVLSSSPATYAKQLFVTVVGMYGCVDSVLQQPV